MSSELKLEEEKHDELSKQQCEVTNLLEKNIIKIFEIILFFCVFLIRKNGQNR